MKKNSINFFLIFQPNGMRHSLQSMGTMYDRLNTKTIKIQPMPTFMSRLLPEVNKLVYTKDENLIKFIMQREDRYPRRAGYLSHNMQSIQKDLGAHFIRTQIEVPDRSRICLNLNARKSEPENTKFWTYTLLVWDGLGISSLGLASHPGKVPHSH